MRPVNVLPKYDGLTSAGLDAYEERVYIYNRDRGECQFCGEPVAFAKFQLAHRIANTKTNRKRWGAAVVDSPLNQCVTHPGRCNDGMNIGQRPVECAELAARIAVDNCLQAPRDPCK